MRSVMTLLAASVISGVVVGQGVFEERVVVDHYPPIMEGAQVAFDVDMDGDIDLIAGNRVYRNDGAGGLVPDATLLSVVGVLRVAADADSDGDLDLFVLEMGLWSGALHLLSNDGSGSFSSVWSFPMFSCGTHFEVFDADGDGDVDVFAPRSFTPIGSCTLPGAAEVDVLLLNNGLGQFVDASGQLPGPAAASYTARAADFDGDGDADLLVDTSTINAPNPGSPANWLLWQNNGTGSFTLAATMPSYGRLLALADVDGDGDQDVLSDMGLLINNGTGLLALSQPFSAPAATVACDIDADGDVDFVSAHSVFVNDGAGNLIDEAASRYFGTAKGQVVAMDRDGDGDLDLQFGSGTCFLNSGAGVFTSTWTDWVGANGPSNHEGSFQIDLADMDGDGSVDVVAGSYLVQKRGLFFTDEKNFLRTSYNQGCVIDADGDGDLDVATSLPDGLWRNSGGGVFNFVPGALGGVTHLYITRYHSVDIDGDGDQDLLATSHRGAHLFLNDGVGNFVDVAATAFPIATMHASDLAVADVDQDGDLDVVLSARGCGWAPGSQNMLFLNDGSGNAQFTDGTAQLPLLADDTWCVTVADWDADGDVDLFFGNDGQDALLTNNGSGYFSTSAALPVGQGWTHDVATGDLDDDGDLDLAIADYGGAQRILLNDGTGVFAAPTQSMWSSLPIATSSIALADLDEDGDVDIVFSQGESLGYSLSCALGSIPVPPLPESLHMVRNLTRHLEATKLPYVGGTFEMTVMTRGSQATWTVPMLATAAARVPIPGFGTLLLDPAGLLLLQPSVLVPSSATSSELQVVLPLPTAASLVGFELHGQALLLNGTSVLGFTNRVATRLQL